MANTFRIKRRVTGLPGSPAGLKNAELAYNEVEDILYYGKGISTLDNAATVIAIGGAGLLSAYMTLGTTQTVSGDKTFTGLVNVGTVAAADNSVKAASTAWVRGYAQPLNASLTALAALVTTGFHVQTGPTTVASRSITGTAGRITVADGNGVAGNPVLDLATSGVAAGAYAKVTVDVYGRVVSGGALTLLDITTGLGFTPENTANKGIANGYASLDGAGKVPNAQLPSSVLGGLNYQGTWNASTNTPTLANGVGTKGHYYKVTVAGNTTIDGDNNWTIGDLIVYNGTEWDKIEGGTSDVISVAGKVGVVTLVAADIGGLGTLALQNAAGVNITGGTIAASTIVGNITGNAVNVTGIVAVANGGTGAATLTGYVRGNGTAAMTATATIPVGDITGLALVAATGSASDLIAGTLLAARMPALTGDVTSAVGTVATTISNGAVSLAKMSALAAGTFIGNNTGAAATPTALTAVQAKALLAITAADISGLGTMSLQNANAVNITGGTVDNLVLDGGTF